MFYYEIVVIFISYNDALMLLLQENYYTLLLCSLFFPECLHLIFTYRKMAGSSTGPKCSLCNNECDTAALVNLGKTGLKTLIRVSKERGMAELHNYFTEMDNQNPCCSTS